MLPRATLPPPIAVLTATGEVEDMVVEDMVEDMVEEVEEVPSSFPGWRACLAGLSLGG